VTDQSGTTEGLTVIDLSDLPNSAPFFHWTPNIEELNGTLNTCHNIYIDEFGYAYLAGCNLNSGGMIFIDVFTSPGNPSYAGAGFSIYAHDVYTRDNLMYSSELNAGRMAIYDVTDKADVVPLGNENTPFTFTHNIWLSDDGNTAFTTDEQPNAPVAAYDVSDPSDIEELDQYRPTETLNDGVIPHNVHVWEDWLIISYYTDGGVVVDASRPDNMVEVGNYDTYFGNELGFNGVWGAYPFLPSGRVLLTDIGNGLYVLEPNYVRAAFLEGTVTDANTGAAVPGTEIIINSTTEDNINFSRLNGSYGTGLATAGTYDVTFFKPGYEMLTTSATINNGEVTILDVQLVPLPRYTIEGLVREEEMFVAVDAAIIQMTDGFITLNFTSDAAGNFVIEDVYRGTWDIYVGAWGYRELLLEGVVIESNDALIIELPRGYEDSFTADHGWVATAGVDTRDGFWERGNPNGTTRQGNQVNPEDDVADDLGEACYVTGNNGGSWTSDDVDGGVVTLTSPIMELATNYVNPTVEYNLWFWTGGGNGTPDDELEVSITNGTETVVLEVVSGATSEWLPRSEILLSEVIEITDQMQLIVETSDFDDNGHVVEAGIDAFSVTGDLAVNTSTPTLAVDWEIAPNPFKQSTQIRFQLTDDAAVNEAQVIVRNSLGQIVSTVPNVVAGQWLELGVNWASGVYFVELSSSGQASDIRRIVKQ
ncbi:MAG: choice-of-anchor B family protein, partial [Bacteroidota bacterium]